MPLHFGLLGEKLAHSLSPMIHNIIFQYHKIDASYQLFEVKKEMLECAVIGLNALNFRGVNVTIPYKSDIIPYLHHVSNEARNIGSINTILYDGGKAIGYNTDYFGFGDMLKSYSIDIKNKSAVILGTGGSSKAVIQYLLDNGIGEIALVSRDPISRNENMPMKSCCLIDYNQLAKLPDMDMVINCTPCGMFPHTDISPITEELFSKYAVAVDLIYNPAETLFLRLAKAAGCKTLNGLYMLVSQAAAAEMLWNDIQIDKEQIDSIYNKLLEHCKLI